MGEISELGTKAASRRTGEGLGQTALELAERIDDVLKLAERTAAEIEHEAEVSAERYLEERRAEADREVESRVGDASRALTQSATDIAQLSSSLRARVERALEEVTGLERAAHQALASLPSIGEERTGPGGGPAGRDPEAASETTIREPRGAAPEEPLLRAAQMAVRGSTREEIESVLTSEYGIENPDEIVGEILGDTRP